MVRIDMVVGKLTALLESINLTKQVRSSAQDRRTNQKGQNEICTPLCEGDNHLFDAQVGEQIQRIYLYIFVACVVCNVIVVLFLSSLPELNDGPCGSSTEITHSSI